MSVIELINTLTEKNIQLWLENDQLRFSAPKNALSTALRDQIRAHKAEIIVFLQRNQQKTFTPITVTAATAELPLSFAQQRIWFLQQLDSSSKAFYIHSAFEIKGLLNIQRLEQALQQLHQRHSILRSAYKQKSTGLCQEIIAEHEVNLQVEKLSPSTDISNREKLLETLLEQQSISFDLEQGQVTSNHLYQIDQQHFIFCCCIHHIAADGWSMNILAEELLSLYANSNAQLPTLSVQYKDYAHWQQNPNIQAERQFYQQQAMTYWQQELTDMPVLYLNAKSRDKKTISSQGASFKFKLDRQTTQLLTDFAAQEQVTLFSCLLSVFSALLYRYSGQNTFAIGTAIAGRSEAICEPLIGCFMNLLAIKNEHSGEQNFRQLLQANHEKFTQALAYQDIAFENVVKQLGLAGSSHTTPVFQTLFVLQNMPFQQAKQLNDITIGALPVNTTSAHYDLSLLANEWQGEIFAELNYKSHVFNAKEVAVMAESFQILIQQALHQPQNKISQLQLFNANEQQRLMALAQGEKVSRDATTGLHHLIERQVVKTPEHTACIFEQQQLTYQDLNKQANQLAHYILQLQSDKPISVIAVSMQRSIQLPIVLLAILKSGAAYVPLEPDLPVERCRFILQQSDCQILISEQKNTSVFAADVEVIIDLNVAQDWKKTAHTENLKRFVQPRQLANIIYTSGSSGQPKGVMVSHQALVNRLQWMSETFALQQGDKVLQKTTFSFDVSVWEIFWPLMLGACSVLAKPEGQKDNHYLINLIQQHNIRVCHFVPSMLQLFLQTPKIETCRDLKQVICSGEVLSQELQDDFLHILPNTHLSNLYGPTEAAIDVSFHHCSKETPCTIGKAISNTQLYILNQQQQLMPQGSVGEIAIAGIGVAEGYIGDKMLSDKHFIKNTFTADGDEVNPLLYKTGDFGSYDDQGQLHFHGRIDSQVKVHGFRIELSEIELQLLKHPLINDVAVVLNPDNQVTAFYQCNDNSLADKDISNTLSAYLSMTLPSYMLPQIFIVIEDIPYMSSGKRDLKKLMQYTFAHRYDRAVIAANTETEKKLHRLWAALLKQKQLSIHDNFFESGGHSILAINLQMQIEETFSIRLSLSDLLNHPTIYVVAQKIDDLIMIQQGLKNLEIDDKDLGEDEEEISL